jgi:RNA polymerase sigma factor (sigma-70 family)
MSDKQLWIDFIAGDEKASKIIYETNIQLLFKYGCHFSSDEELIKDCIQDLFIDLLHYRQKIRQTDNIKAYLLTSFRRKIINEIKEANKLRTIHRNDFPFDYSLLSSDTDESFADEQYFEKIKSAMQTLSARQKEAIYLKYVVGLGYKELCPILQVDYQVARNMVHKGIEKLRQSIFKSNVLLWFLLIRREIFIS